MFPILLLNCFNVNDQYTHFSAVYNMIKDVYICHTLIHMGVNQDYTQLIDWDTAACTEPPMTMTKELGMTEILTAFASPLHLPAYPNNTHQVERKAKVVTKVASKRVGYNAQH